MRVMDDRDAPAKPTAKTALGYRILNWVGIIEQLARNRANREMADIGLPWPQFVLLSHFSHRPEEGKTVTAVARAMQQQQPAATKTLQAMVAAGLMRVEPDARDRRIKHHFVTEKGRSIHAAAVAQLGPLLDAAFSDWTETEMAETFSHLDRLKVWLDENR